MIPSKSSFKFEELTPITGIKPYVLRYWETEFPEIAPVHSDSGHKVYARKDLEVILRIKKLLFEDKLTIPAAKALVANESLIINHENEASSQVSPLVSPLTDVRSYLENSLDLINDIKIKRNW